VGQNLELKIKLESNEKIKTKLENVNVSCSAFLNQKDTYYKWTKGLLKLRQVNGRYELIKYQRDEKSSDRWSNYEILEIKGKNPETYLGDIFSLETIVEKIRMLYIFKNTRIHLDSVKNLGEFLELETVVNGTKKEAQKEFDEVISLLNITKVEPIRCSYRDLVLAKL
jgi:adenylate cyclase class 2